MGYIGNRMSVRAFQAYQAGEKPRSKWAKSNFVEGFPSLDLSHLPLTACREKLLQLSSWHHTGEYFNRTNFYQLTDEEVDQAEVDRWASEARKVKAKTPAPVVGYGRGFWTEWEGTKRHPRPVFVNQYGVYDGTWFYPVDGGRKLLTARGFRMSPATPLDVKRAWRAVTGSLKGFKKFATI